MNKIILLFLLMPLSGYLLAQSEPFTSLDDPGILKDGLESMSEQTNTIESKFVQEKHMQLLTKGFVSKGHISFKKPDKLRWEYSDPFEYLIVINGEKIHIQNEGKTNTFDMATSKLFLEINNLIINTVKGNILDEEKFDIEYFQSSSHYMARLFTKDPDMKEFIDHLEIMFQKQDFSVSKLKLVEPSGDYTFITFIDSKYNEPIDDASFTLN